MTGQTLNQGKRFIPIKIVRSLKEILVKDSTWININHCLNCHSFTYNYRGKALSTQRETFDVNAG